MDSFDEAYAKYQSCLARLDETDDVSEKNQLFRQLAEQLTEMERRLRQQAGMPSARDDKEQYAEPTYWI